MDEFDSALLDSSVASASASSAAATADPSHGWQKVTYPKRHRKQQQQLLQPAAADPYSGRANGGDKTHVFDAVERRAYERRRKLEAEAAAAAAAYDSDARIAAALAGSDEEGDESGGDGAPREEGGQVKKPKVKKPKKPKVTVAEAAAAIDAENLAAHLVEISGSYETQQNIQLMRFADYFGRSFVSLSASQFPWAKTFKESPVSKIVDIPLSHISDSVYKTATDWIGQKSPDALGDFVLWCLDNIIADLSSQQASAKGSKKSVQQSPSRSQVAMFVVVAMTLRRKPDILINLLPKIMTNSKYQGQEKLPIIVWIIAQASQGDVVLGMFCWAHFLFPTIFAKSGGNPQSRDLVLQLVERIMATPKARSILLNGAVRKGERLVPPATFELLMRASFPLPTSRIKATERFEAVYPILKELALAGPPGSKTVKQASQQLLPLCVKAMKENNPELTKEAADIFIWCLTQNPECYKQWEKLHLENLEASVVVLGKISNGWKELSAKLAPDALRETVKSLKAQNEAALSEATDSGKQALIKEGEKYCKVILGRLTRRSSCLKGGAVVVLLAVAVGFALSPNMESDWNKIQAMLASHLSF